MVTDRYKATRFLVKLKLTSSLCSWRTKSETLPRELKEMIVVFENEQPGANYDL